MPSEYLYGKSTRLEISLIKTEIICIMSRYSPTNVEWKNEAGKRDFMREHFFLKGRYKNIFVK